MLAVKDPRNLSHYTDTEGLEGITRTGELWCTGIRHLNDRSEYHYVHEVARQVLALAQAQVQGSSPRGAQLGFVAQLGLHPLSVIQSLHQEFQAVGTFYVASFSARTDDLSQWRGYGEGAGIEMRFQLTMLRELANAQGFSLIECDYNPNHLWEALQNRVNVLLDALAPIPDSGFQEDKLPVPALATARDRFWNSVVEIAPQFKNPSFGREEEWRLVSAPRTSVLIKAADEDVKYRVRRRRLVPYIAFNLMKPDEFGRPQCEALQQVIVGPGGDTIDGATIAQMLHRRHFFRAGVSASSVPFGEPRR